MSRKVNRNETSGKNHHANNVDWGKVKKTQKEETKKGIKNHSAGFAGHVGAGAIFGGVPGAAVGAATYVTRKTIEHCVNTYIKDLD
ncbi:MAG: hypothetical protein ACYCYE_14200 [Clostridia bacterium]